MTPAPALESPAALPPARPRAGGLDARALGALYGLTLRQHLHGKRWVAAAALFLLPAALVVVIRSTAREVPGTWLEFLFAFLFIPQALLPLVALLYASGMIQDEQEEQTITYLLIRPIPKWALYAVKLLATLTTTVVLTAVFTALTFAAVYVGGDAGGENIPLRCLKAVGVHSLAVAAYCCVFGLMSLLTKRTLVVGILYAVIVEGLMANLPLSVRLVTVIYYARVIVYRAMAFVIPTPRGPQDIAAEPWRFDAADPALLEHPRLATCALVLAGGGLACAAVTAWLCARREFHVKTPEKG